MEASQIIVLVPDDAESLLTWMNGEQGMDLGNVISAELPRTPSGDDEDGASFVDFRSVEQAILSHTWGASDGSFQWGADSWVCYAHDTSSILSQVHRQQAEM
ncbi:hypothetical protein MKZ38_009226 [Zalerion maritima]|uniref:Uncharacterized protein n=1 Tax=Zalerion maritima TaxID=339359 RepID=A0AAD5RVF1_9PEZI|nr:hypothetical protein MKZ38_009226 [Zalerion maritima]